MRKRIFFAFLSTCLAACTSVFVSPVDQIEERLEVDPHSPQQATTEFNHVQTTAVKREYTLYYCSDRKNVRVVALEESHNAIRLIFNKTSHHLSASLPKDNKRKYSNIRWIWTEDFNGKCTLTHQNGDVLAKNCVKK